MSTYKDLINLFAKVNSPKEMENLLNGILTPKERVELVQRIDIIKMLKAGIPHHEIAQKLGVGVATVTRGSKEIQKGNFKVI